MSIAHGFVRRFGLATCIAVMLGAILSVPAVWASEKFIHKYGDYMYEKRADAEKNAPSVGLYELKKVCPKNSSPKVLKQELEGCKPNERGNRWHCRKVAEYVCN